MRVLVAACGSLLTACSFSASLTAASPDDAGGDASDAVVDAEPDGSVGVIDMPFGMPALVTELMSPQLDDDVTLPADMLEIYFSSSRDGGDDIWRATRTAIGQPWTQPAKVPQLSSQGSDSEPEIAADGLTIRLTRPGSGGADIYQATRASRTAEWSSPARVAALSSNADDYAAAEDASGLRLVLSSLRGGLSAEDVFVAVRAAGAAWGPPVAVTSVNSSATDSNPYLFADGTALCFDSDRGSVARELYVARRATAADAFEPPVAIAEVNSSAWDSDCWISPDLRTIYFVSERTGNREIYVATR